MSKVIDHLRRAVRAGGEAGLTDGQLLECFVSRRDEAAVAALVRRHGPMVWGVCRRVLRNHHDAEDAFQATFLVLVRKAGSIMPREMVANWLYGVAHRTALKARATTAKRQAREKQVNQMPEAGAVTEPGLWHDLQPLLDRELSRLPDKYRVAIVLCDLEGKTRKEVARQLKIPEGTLSSRLTTARKMLAKRLARHGVRVSGGALAAVLSHKAASACVPTPVVCSTIKAVSLVAAGTGAAGAVSIKAAALTEGVVKAMFMTKRKIAAAALLAVGMLGLGTTVVTYRAPASERGAAPNAATTKVTGKDGEKVVQDAGIPKAVTPEKSKADGQPAVPAPKAEDKENETKEKPPEGRAGNNPKLRALLRERLEALRKGADRVKQLHKDNAASQGAVREANLRVYKAELDLCDTTAERVAVLEKIAKVYKETEDQFSQLQKRGGASEDEVREATISRLEAEIALEREKVKLAAPPK
jgi:RNA polymerase sigma factor (sigma-70 family)